MFLKKAHPVQKIEADLQAYGARRPKLQSQLAEAEAALEAARNERRELLIGDDAENATARAAIEKKFVGAERDVATYTDVLAAIDSKIADARERLVAARDKGRREEAAKAREDAAVRIEGIALRLEHAIDGLGAVADELRESIDPSFIDVRRYRNFKGNDDKPLDHFELVRLIIAEGMFSRSPELFTVDQPDIGGFAEASMKAPMRRPDGALCVELTKDLAGVNFLPASGAVERNLVIPLRQAAQEILEGKRLPYSVAARSAGKTVEPQPFEIVDVVCVKPMAWIAENGQRTSIVDNLSSLPTPVAERAIALGVAFPKDSDEARAHLDCRKRWRVPTTDGSDKFTEAVDLGVDLERLMAAERARLNGYLLPAEDDSDFAEAAQ
jgi:hypothetical protein